MPKFTAVDHNPFEEDSGGIKITPVDHNPFEQIEAPKSFLGSLSDSLSKRGGNIYNELADTSFTKSPTTALRVAGQGAGILNDLQGNVISTAYRNLMPQEAQDYISSGVKSALSTDVGKAGLGLVSKGQEAYSNFKQAHPEEAKNIEAIGNIATLIPVSKAFQAERAIGQEGTSIVKDVAQLTTKKVPVAYDKALGVTVRDGMNKAIRPSVVGKATQATSDAYYNKAKSAVESIVQNKPNLTLTDKTGDMIEGALPKSLHQFSEAIDQTKKGIFTEYDNLVKTASALDDAGATGLKISLSPISKELNNIAGDEALSLANPKAAQYAKSLMERYGEKEINATTAQDVIKHLNSSLEAFYKNPSYDTANIAYIDAMVANKLRGQLDNAIESATGPGYQELKNKYGALKAIEADVNKRSIVDARKNVKGLIDFTDVFSGAKVAAGLASLDPATFTSGLVAKAIAMYTKHRNNPNGMVEKLFNQSERLIQKRDNPGFNPQSFTGSGLKNLFTTIRNKMERGQPLTPVEQQTTQKIQLALPEGDVTQILGADGAWVINRKPDTMIRPQTAYRNADPTGDYGITAQQASPPVKGGGVRRGDIILRSTTMPSSAYSMADGRNQALINEIMRRKAKGEDVSALLEMARKSQIPEYTLAELAQKTLLRK